MANRIVVDAQGTPHCPRCRSSLVGVRHRASDGRSVTGKLRVRCTGCGKRLAPARRGQYRKAGR